MVSARGQVPEEEAIPVERIKIFVVEECSRRSEGWGFGRLLSENGCLSGDMLH